jgi:hypothetical protein
MRQRSQTASYQRTPSPIPGPSNSISHIEARDPTTSRVSQAVIDLDSGSVTKILSRKRGYQDTSDLADSKSPSKRTRQSFTTRTTSAFTPPNPKMIIAALLEQTRPSTKALAPMCTLESC